MKPKFRIILSTLAIFFLTTACGKAPEKSSSVNVAKSITGAITMTAETTWKTSTTTIMTPASTTPVTSPITTEEVPGEYEKQITAFILQTRYTYDEEIALERAEKYIKKAEELSVNNYGAISDENGAIEFARSVFLEEIGKDYIDRLESDFVEVDGKQMGYQRYSPPYKATYYDDYDAWLVMVTPIMGIRDDGVKFAAPGSDKFVVMRGSDGKVIAVFL